MHADVVIARELPHTSGQFGFGARERLIAAGEKAALERLEALRRAIGR